MLKRFTIVALASRAQTQGLNPINIKTVPLDSKHEMVQPYASPFLGVRALGSAAAVTCKLPYGTGDRFTVTCP